MKKVELFFKPEHAEVVESLIQEGVIDAALRTYCDHDGEAQRFEVCVEQSEIGFDLCVRGFTS